MGDLVCVRIFFPKPLGIVLFITLHAALFTMKNILFLVKDVFFFWGAGGRHVFPSISCFHQNPPSPPPPPQNSNGRPLIRIIAVEFVHSIKTRQRFNGHVKCTVRVSTLCCEDIYCRYCIQKSNYVVPPMIYRHLL